MARMSSCRVVALAIALAACSGGAKSAGEPDTPGSPVAQPAPADKRFDALAAQFLAAYYADHPVRATALGVHDHDGKLPRLDQPALQARARELHGYLERLATIGMSDLSQERKYDRQILDHAIRAELLELEQVRSWQRNPLFYSSRLGAAVSTLIDRDFASIEVRVRALTARLTGFPRVLAAARANLRDVPEVFATLGVKSTRGLLAFLRGNLVQALAAQGFDSIPAVAVQRWKQAHTNALIQLDQYLAWLERELAPTAKGEFRLGRKLFEQKLRYEEHVALTADELRTRNEAAITRYQQWIAREAAKIDASRSAEQVIADIVARHPGPTELIATAAKYVRDAQAMVRAKRLVTLPTRALPMVRPDAPVRTRGLCLRFGPGALREQSDAGLLQHHHCGSGVDCR